MNSRSPYRVRFASILLLAFALGYPGSEASGAERLARYQGDLPSRFSLAAGVAQPVPCPKGEPVPTTEIINIAVDHEIAVAKYKISYEAAPAYKKPDALDLQSIDYDERGNYLVWRELETLFLSTPDGDQTLKHYRLFRVSPAGIVVEEPTVHKQLIKSPSSLESGVSDVDLVVLTLGQGFSRYLGETAAAASSSPARKLRASGRLHGKAPGVWDVTFSKENDQLVREAGFWGKEDYPMFSVATSGVAEIEGANLARRGEVRLGDPERPYQLNMELQWFSANTGESLIAEVQAAFAKPLEKGNEILDLTGKDIARTFVGDFVGTPTPGACCVCETISKTVSECGHLEDSIRCASDWCIKNVINTATCKNTQPNGVASCPIVSLVPPQPMVVQTPILLPNGGCGTGGNAVNYSIYLKNYDGCNGCAPTGLNTIETACEVDSCPAGMALTRCASPRGIRRSCA